MRTQKQLQVVDHRMTMKVASPAVMKTEPKSDKEREGEREQECDERGALNEMFSLIGNKKKMVLFLAHIPFSLLSLSPLLYPCDVEDHIISFKRSDTDPRSHYCCCCAVACWLLSKGSGESWRKRRQAKGRKKVRKKNMALVHTQH